MAKCVNINHPDFKELVSKSNVHPAILAAQMGVWMEKNNTDEWPKLEQLNIVSGLSTVFEKKFEPVIKDVFNGNTYERINSRTPIQDKKDIIYKHNIYRSKDRYYIVLNDKQQERVDKYITNSRGKGVIGKAKKGFVLSDDTKGTLTYKLINGQSYLFIDNKEWVSDKDNIKTLKITRRVRIPVEMVYKGEEGIYLENRKTNTVYVPLIQKEINKRLLKTKGISAKKSANYYLLQYKTMIISIAKEFFGEDITYDMLRNLDEEQKEKFTTLFNSDVIFNSIYKEFTDYVDSLDINELRKEIIDLYSTHFNFDQLTHLESLLNYLPEEFLKLITFQYINQETAYFNPTNIKNNSKKYDYIKAAKSTKHGMLRALALNVAIKNMLRDGYITADVIEKVNNEIKKYLKKFYAPPKKRKLLIANGISEDIIDNYWYSAISELQRASIDSNKGLTQIIDYIINDVNIPKRANIFSEVALGEIKQESINFKYDKIAVLLHELGHGLENYLKQTNKKYLDSIESFITDLIKTNEFQEYIREGLRTRGYDETANQNEIRADVFGYIVGKAIGYNFDNSHLKTLDDFFWINSDLVNSIFQQYFDTSEYKDTLLNEKLKISEFGIVNFMKYLINEMIDFINYIIGNKIFENLEYDSKTIEVVRDIKEYNLGHFLTHLEKIILDQSNFNIDSLLQGDNSSRSSVPSGITNNSLTQLKIILDNRSDITIKDIEKHIAGLADTFSKRKFNGHYTVRREDIINVGFSRAQMARNIVAEINRIIPNLLYLEENPIYYKDQKTGEYLRDKKTNELVQRGDTWLKLIISEDALKDYLNSKAFPEFEFQASDNLTEEHIKELTDNIPEFENSIGDKLPMEFDQFENPEADPRLVNIIYTEAQKVRNLLDEYIEDRTNPMMLLATIESRVGLSDSNSELRNVLEPLSGYLSQVELKIITRNDLHSIEKGAFKQHINDFGFTHMSAKTNKRVIYLIKDNLDRPGDGSFDLLAATILHELYHNILFEAIDNPVTEDEKQLAKEVTNLFKAAKSQTSYRNSPAYKNIQEFVVQGLTNHNIVSELKGMQYNWWQRFIRAIVNFFTKNTDAGVEGKSLTYYDSLFNSVIGYVNKQRKLKPLLYAEVTLAADDTDFFIQATTKKTSLSDNAKYIETQLNNKLKAYHNYVGNVAPTEAQFISVEHGLNILGLSGVPSDLISKEKDLSKLGYNKSYSTIRSAIENYNGRTKIGDKERVIEMLESKFGKDAAIVTNAMIYNIERKLFDVIDFVVVHKYENTSSPVYSIVNFYESNGTMSTFKDTIIPKKKGLYRPMSKKNRERVRLSFSAGLLNRSIDKDHKYNAYSINIIPINEDTNGKSTVESDIVKLELSRSTFFLWSENFDKARAQAYDDLQANIDLDLSEEVQNKINEYYSKIEMEEFNLSVADKLLQKAVKMLNTRANISKMYGRKLAVIEIEKLVTDMVLNYQEPREGITELVNYIHKELTKATKVLSETDLENKKINKNALTAFIKMTKSFEIIKDINVYFKSIKEDIPELKEIRSKISESIEALATIEVEYKNRAINLLVDYLAPYYSRLKYEQIEKYKQNYRLFQHRLKEQDKGNTQYTDKFVPKNFNRNLTEEEYVATQYKLNEAAIKDGTRHIIAKELVQASKDIGYLELMVDNILDTGDAVVGSFVKSLAIIDDERRLAVEEKRMQYLPILEEYEKYLANTGKVFTNYLDMYEFMLERDPDTNKLTGHILTEFSSELLEEKKVIFLSTEIYNDREEAKKVRSAWLNENMPINTSKYIDALWEHVKLLASSGKINEKDLKAIHRIILNNTKYIDIKYFVDEGIITEEIGDNLFEWIATNQNRFREPAEHWQTKQWKELKKILDNKDDPRTKVYNAIIELRDYADSLVPASRGINNRLPGVVKQKAERVATGQPIHTLITDSLAKTFTFQVDDTHRHSEIITEDKEALYFIPIHYNKRIVKTTEDGVVRFDEDNQSFDLFGIYFSYMSSAIEYNKKHSLLAEIDMFKNLMKQRELIKNSSLTETLKTIKEKPSDILKLGSKEEAVVVGGNMYQMLNAWLNATVFGQYEQDLGTFLGMDVGKIIEFIKKYTAINLLGLNIIQGVANVSLGEINQWIESIAGEFFKPKDYAKAHIDYMKNLAGMIADAGSRKPTNILTLIAQHFDISEMPSVQRVGKQSKIGSMSLDEMAHLTSSSGEHFMRIKFMDSMLYEKKAFDKDGNEIGSIRDFYTIENSKLVFDKDGKVDITRSMWTTEDQNDFKQRLEGLLGRIHGDYSNLARVYIQGHPVASMAYMFRKFLAPGWRRHWGKHRYETRNLQSVEGMYITTFNFLFKPFVDAFRAKRNLESEQSEILDLTFGERWAMLSDHQRANLMRTALEMVNIAIFMILLRVLGGDDDDEITYADEFIMYQLLRLKSEILFFLSPFEAMKILRSPAASMSVFENTFQLFKQAMNPLEVYERGPWEGQLKIYKRLVNMVPVYRQAYRLRDVGDQIPWFQR